MRFYTRVALVLHPSGFKRGLYNDPHDDMPSPPLCASPAALITHPLLVQLRLDASHQPIEWHCHSSVPDPHSYMMRPRTRLPHAEDTLLLDGDWARLAAGSRLAVMSALAMKRISVLWGFCALLDTRTRSLHYMDLIGERDGRACVVLLYYTRRSVSSSTQDMQEVEKHCRLLQEICATQYSVSVTPIPVNVYCTGSQVQRIQVNVLLNPHRRPPRPSAPRPPPPLQHPHPAPAPASLPLSGPEARTPPQG